LETRNTLIKIKEHVKEWQDSPIQYDLAINFTTHTAIEKVTSKLCHDHMLKTS